MQWRIGAVMMALTISACQDSGGPAGIPDLPEPTAVARVEIAPRSGLTQVGGAFQFVATAFDEDGNVVVGRAVAWTSMNSSVAEVSQNGLARGMATGTSMIRATVDGVSTVARFEVEEVNLPPRKPGNPDRPDK